MSVTDDELDVTVSAVRRGATRLSRRLRAERPADSLSASRLSVLAHLHRRGPMTPGELATADRLQPQSMTRVLADLERAALIHRERDATDRRQSRITITDAGRAALGDDMRQRDAWLARALAAELTPTEQGLLRLAATLMDRLADADAGPAPAPDPAPDPEPESKVVALRAVISGVSTTRTAT